MPGIVVIRADRGEHSQGPFPRGPRVFVIQCVYRCHCLLEVNLIIHNSVKVNCSGVIILEICPK